MFLIRRGSNPKRILGMVLDNGGMNLSHTYMQEQLDFIYPDLKIVSVRLLKSEGGGKGQSWYTDFTRWDFPRFAGIISFDNSTKLMIKYERKTK